jgi:hypothetical protein
MHTFIWSSLSPSPKTEKREKETPRKREKERETEGKSPRNEERKWKMVVEEALKSATTEEESNTNINMIANPNPNPRAGGAGEEDEEPEEGEIVGEDEDSKQTGTEVVHQSHPLEHSWTFWFDNPAAKSKQAAWGSSLRPIYTFSTVEEFWRLNVCFFFFFCYTIQYVCVLGFCFWLVFVWVLRRWKIWISERKWKIGGEKRENEKKSWQLLVVKRNEEKRVFFV